MSNQYIKFNMLQRPFHDRAGQVLKNISDRKNRFGVDEILGGGPVFPNVSQEIIAAQYSHGLELILILAITEFEAQAIVDNDAKYPVLWTYKVNRLRKNRVIKPVITKNLSLKDFNPRRINRIELDKFLVLWFPRGLDDPVPY